LFVAYELFDVYRGVFIFICKRIVGLSPLHAMLGDSGEMKKAVQGILSISTNVTHISRLFIFHHNLLASNAREKDIRFGMKIPCILSILAIQHNLKLLCLLGVFVFGRLQECKNAREKQKKVCFCWWCQNLPCTRFSLALLLNLPVQLKKIGN